MTWLPIKALWQGFLMSRSDFRSTRVLRLLILNGWLGLVRHGGVTRRWPSFHAGRRFGPGRCLKFHALPQHAKRTLIELSAVIGVVPLAEEDPLLCRRCFCAIVDRPSA